MMELFGTNFSITLGSWRLRFCVALEDTDAPVAPAQPTPHKVRIVNDEDYSRRNASFN
jgi:hypothetical protein